MIQHLEQNYGRRRRQCDNETDKDYISILEDVYGAMTSGSMSLGSHQ